MTKILKRRKMTIEEQDRHTIRLLRQEYFLNEQQLTFRMIDQKEHDENLKKLMKKIIMLEAKYGIR